METTNPGRSVTRAEFDALAQEHARTRKALVRHMKRKEPSWLVRHGGGGAVLAVLLPLMWAVLQAVGTRYGLDIHAPAPTTVTVETPAPGGP